mmetsp:Transcript_12401/g.39530  ORF Transcript_12401/g.39530 Transcript_12401/m.39530 type:complete len:273 (-) Transcript_12401:434-1252(-)
MRQPGPLTTRAFAALPSSSVLAEAGGAGGSSLLQSLVAQEQSLQSLFRGEWPTAEPPEFVLSLPAPRPSACDVDVDVAVCGGTLGILVGCALQLRGHRVAVVEAGPLRGRAQDWNGGGASPVGIRWLAHRGGAASRGSAALWPDEMQVWRDAGVRAAAARRSRCRRLADGPPRGRVCSFPGGRRARAREFAGARGAHPPGRRRARPRPRRGGPRQDAAQPARCRRDGPPEPARAAGEARPAARRRVRAGGELRSRRVGAAVARQRRLLRHRG